MHDKANLMAEMKTLTKPIRLNNLNCIYCGNLFHDSEVRKTTEHVIGRRFVPKGSLENQWNLIANACESCNGSKSALEDDISAITLLRSLEHPATDPRIQAEAARRLKPNGAISRFTGKPVVQSAVEHTITGTVMNAATFSFSLVGPPHVEPDREDQLAFFHVQAFFFLCTYDDNTQLGSLTPGCFQPLNGAPRSDWGNPVQSEFQRRVAGWPLRVIATGADGYFQIMLRHREPDALWAWAVEWNKQFRLCGFFGDLAAVKSVADSMPVLPMRSIGPNDRYRMEVSLAENDDHLFRDQGSKDPGKF
jgi:hypothetical protein